MPVNRLVLWTCIGVSLFWVNANAEGSLPLPEEEATVVEKIQSGAIFLGMDSSLSKPSVVHAADANDLAYLGQLSAGLSAQMALDPIRGKIYIAGTYYSRGYRGDRVDVVEEHDLQTLHFTRELLIPSKRALAAPMRSAMNLSDDGKWLFIQNVTPAASVTVVNLEDWQVESEVPNPGCYGTYPLRNGQSGFTSLCGDGSAISFHVKGDGTLAEARRGSGLFDPEDDPWFMHAEQQNGRLIFTSFRGTISVVETAGGTPVLEASFNVSSDIEGNWRPGGYQLTAFHQPSGVLFVLMHPGGKEGSHKDTASEIWAVDLAGRKVLSRSKADDLDAITVSGEIEPVVHAVEPGGVYVIRYTSDPSAGYGLTRVKYEEIGSWMPHIEVIQ